MPLSPFQTELLRLLAGNRSPESYVAGGIALNARENIRRLHRFDALTNKALAMAGRAETRDLVDLVANAGEYPLHAICWAACGKDPGYNPLLLLNQMQRNSRINPAELREMGAACEPVALKTEWLALAETALKEIERAAHAGLEPGVAFLDSRGRVLWFDELGVVPHKPSLGGSLPRVLGAHYDL